jgi:hypothetical protein
MMTKTREDHLIEATNRATKLMEVRDQINSAIKNLGEASLMSHEVWDSWPSYYNERPKSIEAGIKLLEMIERDVRDQVFATIEQMASLLGEYIATVARASTEPVLFITGNSMMPPVRELTPAEAIWTADNDGDTFEHFTEALWGKLEDLNILMEAPEYDNALYVVDLMRWEHREEDEITDHDSLNGEWIAKPDFA